MSDDSAALELLKEISKQTRITAINSSMTRNMVVFLVVLWLYVAVATTAPLYFLWQAKANRYSNNYIGQPTGEPGTFQQDYLNEIGTRGDPGASEGPVVIPEVVPGGDEFNVPHDAMPEDE